VTRAADPRPPQRSGAFAPAWATDAVVYHIYPLGLLGAPRRNPGHGMPQPRLLELRRWYDHIQSLGVDTILLGPIFESETHGYDTVDLKRVDRRLGDIDTLRTVIDELHARGMCVLLDGVFNHTGRRFFAFEELRALGKRSPYRDWYRVDLTRDNKHGDGFSYKGWHGSSGLPELNLEHEPVRQHLFEVARYWLEDIGVDGWRLDAASDVAPAFWQRFRAACKTARPDCFLLGELVFGEYGKYLGPDGLDGATHYPLYDAMHRAFEANRFAPLARLLRQHQQKRHGGVLLSFLGNHDVTRLRSRLSEPADFYPAMVLLMSLPFTPCLYYGDECGMTGEKARGDHALRRPMPNPDEPWPDDSRDRYAAIARLVRLRRDHPVLRHGDITYVKAQHNLLAVALRSATATALIVINVSHDEQTWSLSLPNELAATADRFVDALDLHLPPPIVRGDGAVTLDALYPKWGRVLIARH